jgi:hypothetical protein
MVSPSLSTLYTEKQRGAWSVEGQKAFQFAYTVYLKGEKRTSESIKEQLFLST